jgi:hypothetical protein
VSRRAAAALAAACLALAGGPGFAQDAAADGARAEVFSRLPYWPGYWVAERQAHTTIGGFAPSRPTGGPQPATSGDPQRPPAPFMSLAGFNAPWNEVGRQRQAEARAKSGGRKALGWGYPMMMDSATPFQVLITPEETLIVNAYGEVRHVYTDGRPIPAAEDMWPTVWGTSVGHWEGDTLVLETAQVENPNNYFHGAPPLSEEARYVERIRLDGDYLVNEITITDPMTLSGPWTSRLSYVRDEGFDRMVQMDFSNDRTGVENGVNTIEPPADERPASQQGE